MRSLFLQVHIYGDNSVKEKNKTLNKNTEWYAFNKNIFSSLYTLVFILPVNCNNRVLFHIVTKTSTGAIEYVPVARVTNLIQSISTLKKNNFWIFGTAMQGKDYRQWNTTGAIALVIGNEGRGMSQGIAKEVDELITIPMNGHVQSLNAGVASGLLMYEVYRNRN